MHPLVSQEAETNITPEEVGKHVSLCPLIDRGMQYTQLKVVLSSGFIKFIKHGN